MRNTKTKNIFVTILLSIITTTLLLFIIYCFNYRNILYRKVSDLNVELNLSKSENVKLQSEIESKVSLNKIEYYAENVLGMKKINPSQIKYIKKNTGDVVNIIKKDESILDSLIKFILNILEKYNKSD